MRLYVPSIWSRGRGRQDEFIGRNLKRIGVVAFRIDGSNPQQPTATKSDCTAILDHDDIDIALTETNSALPANGWLLAVKTPASFSVVFFLSLPFVHWRPFDSPIIPRFTTESRRSKSSNDFSVWRQTHGPNHRKPAASY
jgi:hypothetical protein